MVSKQLLRFYTSQNLSVIKDFLLFHNFTRLKVVSTSEGGHSVRKFLWKFHFNPSSHSGGVVITWFGDLVTNGQTNGWIID